MIRKPARVCASPIGRLSFSESFSSEIGALPLIRSVLSIHQH
ncbi:hypothetical protein ACCUM_4278 [Candidatus Accumulibacter phosphatis]|uniref:Uncharacterized protein n=1 Tax=Candidatus Accumulibacter phosphatis TaxID=327160 RepID=A0A5S4F6Y9_9PROT|nr:hypothetical protein ACCUM_4278 [Candidatus Accumulibacter phosphatis]